MRKYSVIVFDLGNVLIPFDYKIAVKRFDEVEETLGTRFLEFYKNNYPLHRSHERGDITSDAFINRVLTSLNSSLDKETFCKIFGDIFTFNENVIALLPELKKKYTLVLLSNTNYIHTEYGWKDFPFVKYFDKLILSHEVKAVKPETAIYKAVESFTKKPSEEHIFIDDIAEYGEAAKKLGWDAIQFKNYDQLLAELKERGIL